MLADTKTLIERACAVLEKRAGLVGDDGLEIGIVLAGQQRLAFEKRNRLVQHCEVGGGLDIVCNGVSKPYPIVRNARADALAERRQPPMLNIAFDELPSGGAQEMFSRHRRSRQRKCRSVLKLVAETISAARLIKRRSRPQAAGERLIEQPAVEHDVHR